MIVSEVMTTRLITITPGDTLSHAANLLRQYQFHHLPVVEYERLEQEKDSNGTEALLVGLITRSDLLMALARSLGAFEPGMQLSIPLPMGDLTPLAQTLTLAAELHIQVRSVLAAPLEGNVPLSATLRLGTINPAPLLLRLQEASISYTFVDAL